jgi:hypothetical protein
MGTLEDKEAKATERVSQKLDRQVRRLSSILRKEGNSDVARKINEAITWAGVSGLVLKELAKTAADRSEAAQEERQHLQDFVEGRRDLPALAVERDPANWAQMEILERARTILQPVERLYAFDRAVVLKVWSEHCRVLGQIAGARDLAGLVAALEALAKTATEKASGSELLGLLLDLVDAARKRQRAAADASELFDYLDQLIYTHARWSLAAQAQILRLSSTPPVPEHQVIDEARQRVLQIFERLWADLDPGGRARQP